MTEHPWPYHRLPDDLGVVVHGPVLLAHAPGIGVGLRCVFAHPGGLHLPLVLVARGAPADLAGGLTFAARDERTLQAEEQVEEQVEEEQGPPSLLRVAVALDGLAGPLDHGQLESTGSTGAFDLRAEHYVHRLPADRELRITVAWPEIGLPEATTVLALDDLTDLARRVIPLPPPG